MPLKIPSFADALPLTLGEKLPTPNSIKPSEEWDLIRSDSRGALWKNCAGGRLQFIPNPNSLGPRKDPGKIPPLLQQALNSVGQALKPKSKFKVGDLARHLDRSMHYIYGVRPIVRIEGKKVYFDGYCAWGYDYQLYPCDAEGWIPHTPGDPMPCDGNLEVEIMTREEAEGSIPWRSGPQLAEEWEWSVNLSPSRQILAWKPAL